MLTDLQAQSLGSQLGILTDMPFTVTDLDLYCSWHDLVLEYAEGCWSVYHEDQVVASIA